MPQNNKKIDCTRKLDKEELKKSRKIVLELINDAKSKNISSNKEELENIDSIFSIQKTKTLKEYKENKPKKIVLTVKLKKNKLKIKKNITDNKQLSILKNKEIKENKNIEQKNKKILKQQKTENRKKVKEKIKSNLKLVTRNFLISLKQLKIILIQAIIIFFIFYLFFVIAVLKFEVDNKISRYMSRFLIVPAYITNNGIIEYYDYQDNLKKESIINIAYNDICKNLLKKYGLYTKDKINIEEAKKRVILDREINSVGINRIVKISQIIKNKNEFTEIAGKYGDKQGITNIDCSENSFDCDKNIKNLKAGETSKIIYKEDGYYIYHCYDKNDDDDKINLSFVFVKGISFDEYMQKSIANYELWSFVN